MKITLVYSGIGVAGFNSNRPLGDREGSWIGHGIASIGACLKKDGHRVNLIDLRQLSGWGDFIQRIKADPSEWYCLSISPVDKWNGFKAVLAIRQTLGDVKIAVGGINPTIFTEDYNIDAIDHVIIGEGEVSLPEIIRNGSKEKIIQGVKPDLDKIPWVDRELFDYQRELHCNFTADQRLPSITMLSGRGCPFRCTYCQPAENSVFGKPYRLRSAENVVSEMEMLHKRYEFNSVTFWDDTFTFNKKWVEEFCDRYEKSGLKSSIVSCSRADIICRNEDMIERLASIGVTWFVIGFESGSDRILKLIKKDVTVAQNIEAARICRKHGIKVFATFMYGLPTETEEEASMTKKMIDEIKPEFPSPFWFNPIEGTEIYDFCKDNDLILERSKSVARTGIYQPTLKGVNYDHIRGLMQ